MEGENIIVVEVITRTYISVFDHLHLDEKLGYIIEYIVIVDSLEVSKWSVIKNIYQLTFT